MELPLVLDHSFCLVTGVSFLWVSFMGFPGLVGGGLFCGFLKWVSFVGFLNGFLKWVSLMGLFLGFLMGLPLYLITPYLLALE